MSYIPHTRSWHPKCPPQEVGHDHQAQSYTNISAAPRPAGAGAGGYDQLHPPDQDRQRPRPCPPFGQPRDHHSGGGTKTLANPGLARIRQNGAGPAHRIRHRPVYCSGGHGVSDGSCTDIMWSRLTTTPEAHSVIGAATYWWRRRHRPTARAAKTSLTAWEYGSGKGATTPLSCEKSGENFRTRFRHNFVSTPLNNPPPWGGSGDLPEIQYTPQTGPPS